MSAKGEALAEGGTPTYVTRFDGVRVPATDYRPVWLDSLADDVTIEGSAMNGVVQGAEGVRSIVAYIRTLYDSQEFNFAGRYGDSARALRRHPLRRALRLQRPRVRARTASCSTGCAAKCAWLISAHSGNHHRLHLLATSRSSGPGGCQHNSQTRSPRSWKAEPAAEHGIRLSRALGMGRPGPSSQVLASTCMIAELLRTRVCAMTFAVVARPIYGTPSAKMSPGTMKGCLMEITNLGKADGLPPVDWAAVVEKLDAGSAPAPDAANSRTTWLSTVNQDGSPHVTAVGALWLDGTFWFQTGAGTRKGRNVARDPRCSIAVSIRDADVVVEGDAARVTEPGALARIARAWADNGWPAEPDESGSGITAPFNAPSQGPPPWNVYRIEPHSAIVVLATEPGGLTRFRF